MNNDNNESCSLWNWIDNFMKFFTKNKFCMRKL